MNEENKNNQNPTGDPDSEITLFNTINSAKQSLLATVVQIMDATHLPSCIIDGIVCDILSEVRKQEIYDITASSRASIAKNMKIDKEVQNETNQETNQETTKDNTDTHV